MEVRKKNEKWNFIDFNWIYYIRLIAKIIPNPNDIDSKWRKDMTYGLGGGTLRLNPKARTLTDSIWPFGSLLKKIIPYGYSNVINFRECGEASVL